MGNGIHADALASYSGVIVHNAEARQKTIDSEGHTVPVLVLDIQTDTHLHMPLHIEQPFPVGEMHQCQAAAKRYHKGLHITVHAPVLSHRLSVIASHIHTDHPTPPPTEAHP